MRLAQLCTLLALSTSVTPCSFAQGTHQDERFGFKFQPPKGWSQVPLKIEEAWLVAKYMSDKTYLWTDKEGGWSWEHKPEIMVIAFLEEVIAKAEANEEKEGESKDDKAEDDDEIILSERPYKNYEDFLDRTYSGGGFYISSREQGVENDVPVTKYEVKVEKLAYTGPKRIVTWVFDAEGVDFAVQTELLESSFDKLESTIKSTLRSFRLIPRTKGPLPTEAKIDSGWFISRRSMNEGTSEERRAKRMESERRLHEAALANLPKDWKHEFTKTCLILTHTDAKYTERVSKHCDAIFAWLEERLGFIGPGEYVRRPIVRICANDEERNSMSRGVRSGSYWSFGSGNEILTCKDSGGFTDWEMNRVNDAIFDLWLGERGEMLTFGLPSWIRNGLAEYVQGARLVKNELQFRDYLRDLIDYKIAQSKGETTPVRDLVQMTDSEFHSANADGTYNFGRNSQANTFVRYLLSSEASRSKLTKTLLGDYMKNLMEVLAEVEKENFKQGETFNAPKTEEEEEELYKARHTQWQSSEREKQIVQRTFSRTFGSWTDKDWTALEKAFLKSIE